jgi:hypothetical protein
MLCPIVPLEGSLFLRLEPLGITPNVMYQFSFRVSFHFLSVVIAIHRWSMMLWTMAYILGSISSQSVVANSFASLMPTSTNCVFHGTEPAFWNKFAFLLDCIVLCRHCIWHIGPNQLPHLTCNRNACGITQLSKNEGASCIVLPSLVVVTLFPLPFRAFTSESLFKPN